MSDSIGDTTAAIPYISKFKEVNSSDEVYVSISDWLIPYFDTVYDNLRFIGKLYGTDLISNITFDKIITLQYNHTDKPLQQNYAEQLGFTEGKYIRPKILTPTLKRPIKNKYITIGVHSTAQLKYWNHPTGEKGQPLAMNWDVLCGMIRKKGYTPVVVEKDELFGEPPHWNGLPARANKKYGQSFLESMNYVYHSEFFIGLSSGMSWVAHAMGKPVAMISNFTEDWNEFNLSTPDYIRITNKNVCHGCWNLINKEFKYDEYDWNWCPKHKGTERQFECHTSITPEYVFNKIEKWIK